ncbi:hypothetical protein J7K97_05985 [Candidatus Aerophobetes bacterium]|nr:hypothetical protein [Candidatus Aerophobetes bacterium]
MERLLKKALLIGMGAAALTKEKMETLLNDLTTSVDKIEEEDFLSQIIKKGEETREELEENIEKKLRKLIERANLASKDDILRLEKKIDQLIESISKQK